eukprot:scaffold1130_cov195-Pinguiococcus_pyrenoidosus.AAC.10
MAAGSISFSVFSPFWKAAAQLHLSAERASAPRLWAHIQPATRHASFSSSAERILPAQEQVAGEKRGIRPSQRVLQHPRAAEMDLLPVLDTVWSEHELQELEALTRDGIDLDADDSQLHWAPEPAAPHEAEAAPPATLSGSPGRHAPEPAERIQDGPKRSLRIQLVQIKRRSAGRSGTANTPASPARARS